MTSMLLLLALVQGPPANTDNPDPAGLGPQVGQPLPAFSLVDQHGLSRDLASLTGPKGLVLVFFRSADW
jgi:cytochrome oxidase Cu insertion factor (SCO1/SenC/PrrC family)